MIFSNNSSDAAIAKYPAAIQKAIRYAVNTDFSRLEDGRQEIDGDVMFANLFSIESKPVEQTHPELHKKYIDVQYWIGGEELCGIAPADGIGECIEANEGNDLYFYDGVKNESFIHAVRGCFAVFFPDDAHRPGVCLSSGPLAYRKVVVKVSVDAL